jgi:hypothetical protein
MLPMGLAFVLLKNEAYDPILPPGHGCFPVSITMCGAWSLEEGKTLTIRSLNLLL